MTSNASITTEAKIYQKKTFRDHTRARPSSLIGAMAFTRSVVPCLDISTDKPFIKCIQKDTCIPVKRLFNEAIQNATDACDKLMKAGIDPGTIDIQIDNHTVRCTNYGIAISMDIHPEEKIYVPELIFGVPMSGSNLDDSETDNTAIGQNGYGVKVLVVFSEYFMVHIIDINTRYEYIQIWEDGMAKRHDPIIRKFEVGKYTRSSVSITYTLDKKYFAQYGFVGYDVEWIGMIAAECVSASLGSKVPFTFNGKLLDYRDIRRYAEICFLPEQIQTAIIHSEAPLPGSYMPSVEVMLLDTPDNANIFSLVNGSMTIEGGVHVDAAVKCISDQVLTVIKGESSGKKKRDDKGGTQEKKEKKKESATLTLKDVRPHVSVIVLCRMHRPKFAGQYKEKLIAPEIKINIPEKVIGSAVRNWQLKNRLLAELQAKKMKKLSNQEKGKSVLLGANTTEANNAGKYGVYYGCMSYQCEGGSAMTNVVKGMSYIKEFKNARDIIGCFAWRGKMLNAKTASLDDLIANVELAQFEAHIGLKKGIKIYTPEGKLNVEELDKYLRYKYIILKFDGDDDGAHIAALLLCYLHTYHPLMLLDKRVFIERSPLWRIFQKDKCIHRFYSTVQKDTFLKSNLDINHLINQGKLDLRYFKGLGTSEDEDIKDEMENKVQVELIYDEKAPQEFINCFDKDFTDFRKHHISTWEQKYDIESMKAVGISTYLIEEYLPRYGVTNKWRSVPKIMDGFKKSQLQSIWTLLNHYKILGEKHYKVDPLILGIAAAKVTEFTHYHHGNTSMEQNLFKQAQYYVGSNNIPLIKAKGQVGSRRGNKKGIGRDTPAARYPLIEIDPITRLIFRYEDVPLLTLKLEEGNVTIPEYLLPIVPIQLINGCRGIATGWNTRTLPYSPIMVIDYLIAKCSRQTPIEPRPFWRGFTGTISEKEVKIDEKPEILKNEDDEGEEGEVTDIPVYQEGGIFVEKKEEKKVVFDPVPAIELKDLAELSKEKKDIKEVKVVSLPRPMNVRRNFTTTGTIGYFGSDVNITELPIGLGIFQYEKWLESKVTDKTFKAVKFNSCKNPDHVNILITPNPASDFKFTAANLHLITSFSTANMNFLLPNGHVAKFKNVCDLLNYFFDARVIYYEARRRHILTKIAEKITEIDQKLLFRRLVKEKKINVVDDETKKQISILAEHKLPAKMIDRKIKTLAADNSENLYKKREELVNKFKKLEAMRPDDLWIDDLVELREYYLKRWGMDNVQ